MKENSSTLKEPLNPETKVPEQKQNNEPNPEPKSNLAKTEMCQLIYYDFSIK